MSKIRHDTITRVVTVTNGQDITHRCLAGPACRGAEPELDAKTGERRRIPKATDKPNTVCRRCYSAIRLAVEDLPGLYRDLHDTLGDHQRIPGEKVGGGSSATLSPLDVAKDELMSDIAHQLCIAAARVHTARNAAGDPPTALGDCSALIGQHLQALITSPAQLEEEWCGRGESVPTTVNGRRTFKPNMQIVERTGIDTGLKLVKLRGAANARLTGTTTEYWRLPARFDGCDECGEQLYTNGHKVICRACDKDWTEATGGLFNREIRRQAEIERAARMEQLEWCLAEAQWQRDTAWHRLDQAATLAEAIYQPDYDAVTTHQFAELLNGILDGHPTPQQRTQQPENDTEATA